MFAKQWPSVRVVIAVVLASAVAACNDAEPTAATTRADSSSARMAVGVHGSEARPDEDIFVEIAREVPSYAGHFLDPSGQLTAYVADGAAFSAARNAIAQRIQSGRIRLPRSARVGVVAVRKADFTLQQLSDWRDSVFLNVLGDVQGVITDDLDEGRNRVTIGIIAGQESTIEPIVRAKLARMGVPEAAVRFESQAPIRRATGRVSRFMTPPSTLGSKADTLMGGLRVWWTYAGSDPHLCSIGFTAELSGGRHGFIAAAHCSADTWNTNFDDWYYQPRSDTNPTIVANELFDPPGGTCPILWPCGTYRFSDANLNILSTAYASKWRRGLLARPRNRVGNGAAGDTTLSSTRPYLYVVGTVNDVVQGQVIDKIGATTGWTFGTVTNTCQDYIEHIYDPSQQMVRCSYKASVRADGGDSGGPMFTWDGEDGVLAYGILFAESGPDSWFSKWPNVASELNPNNPLITTSINILTDITMSGSPDPSGSLSSGVPNLAWSPVSVTNSTATTTYRVIRSVWDASTYTWMNDGVVIGTTTGTTFVDNTVPVIVDSYTGTSIPAQCQYTYVVYGIEAYNSGRRVSGSAVYFRGDANGATPWQFQCP
ncbi:MAG TPA: hypothetical protein VIP11_09280 [Gemmatimonadaceae bacterium]